jgi:hypothetical protein
MTEAAVRELLFGLGGIAIGVVIGCIVLVWYFGRKR